jgi:8-amino-7-oxononanoate synthase
VPDISLDELLHAALDDRRAAFQLRQRRVVRPVDSTHVEIDGREYVNFCSNNYLGLTHHPRVIEAVARAAHSHGTGVGAAPLISGYTDLHASAERAIARWKGTETAVLFPSGYQANLATIQTIASVAGARGRSVRFLLDKLAHASLIDAVRATALPFRVFPHNDLAKLARLLNDADADEMQVVVTESIFSMDGDATPLAGFADLKARHPLVLLLDEAHGSGVYGANGSGYANEVGLTSIVDVFVVTLSKSLGCAGGAVCASKTFCDALINFGRAYVFSTSVAPTVAAACEAAIRVMGEEPDRQSRVRALANRVRGELKLAGDSPIMPFVLGDEEAAIAAASVLREKGMLVLPVRPPTVPRGTSRLRVTLSCDHSDAEIDALIRTLAELPKQSSQSTQQKTDGFRPSVAKGR